MKGIQDWISHLKERKADLKNYLEKECAIDTQQLSEEQKKTMFADRLKARTLKELKVACIMDRFTLDSYAPECTLLELTPEGWQKEIQEFEPELIFIESAWQGKDNLWYRKIANGSPELYRMAGYCREQGIPIVFWNKEDPVYTDTFMSAARYADVVFTTDMDCIKKYKDLLGHDRVYFLHFAAQPAVHNPVEKYERKDKFCFAGAYYHRYPNRAKTFDAFSEIFIRTRGLDIYDRNYHDPKPEFKFPKIYKTHILGCLDSSEIDVAYKGYCYGINMNSVEQSQTMFARRVFEMLASNTVTVGNYSRGVKNLFGDLTICTNDAKTMEKDLLIRCSNQADYRKYRLLGLRRVLSEHLYEDRLGYIVRQVFGVDLKKKAPLITCFAKPDQENLEYVVNSFNKQSYSNKRLVLAGNFADIRQSNIEVIDNDRINDIDIKEMTGDGYFGVLSQCNYYGENYLLDLALTLRYSDACGIGKASYYTSDGFEYRLNDGMNVYQTVSALKTDRGIFSSASFGEYKAGDFLSMPEITHEQFFSIDEFQFCENYNGENCTVADDMVLYDQGIRLAILEKCAEDIKADELADDAVRIGYREIEKQCSNVSIKQIEMKAVNERFRITSHSGGHSAAYIYMKDFFAVENYIRDNCLTVQISGSGELDLLGVCVFYNANKEKIQPVFPKLNQFSVYEVPEGAKYFKLGFRFTGTGKCDIREIILKSKVSQNKLDKFLSRNNVLVLSNNYPSPTELYKNMFVHKRIISYKQKGMLCDVMRMNVYSESGYREFEGINIIEGQAETLSEILENGNIDTVCVHFLDRGMWEVLKYYVKKVKIIIWAHGADIQPWWRRKCLYTTSEEIERGKKESLLKQKLWKEVLENIACNDMHLVIVSKHFADEIFADYDIELPSEKYSVIHNYIDSDMFGYIEKNYEQRKMILSIRPYASSIYANDFIVKVIGRLKKETFFDELQFMIIGNGILFDEITRPLKKYKNVTLEKRFLRQDEIADLHKRYGVFLTPTRMDTQGVSRDEAMSSGLVPITNNVFAVPEFVDNSCGILAPEEDYLELAEGIVRLYNDPKLFREMSQRAAERVREQSSWDKTIGREINLIYKN